MLLADRFAAASHAEPLNALSELDRAELTALMLRDLDFEDLPGRWQAALLRAEVAQSSGQRPCCAKNSRAASSSSRSLSPLAP
jgi:hypothetical protein